MHKQTRNSHNWLYHKISESQYLLAKRFKILYIYTPTAPSFLQRQPIYENSACGRETRDRFFHSPLPRPQAVIISYQQYLFSSIILDVSLLKRFFAAVTVFFTICLPERVMLTAPIAARAPIVRITGAVCFFRSLFPKITVILFLSVFLYLFHSDENYLFRLTIFSRCCKIIKKLFY